MEYQYALYNNTCCRNCDCSFRRCRQRWWLADEIVEAPVVVAEPAPAATSSVSPTYIVLGVLAALLIAAAVDAADDDDDDEEEE